MNKKEQSAQDKQMTMVVDEAAADEDDDEGLEFVDPIALQKAKIAEVLANKDQSQKPKMVKINGEMVPVHTVSFNAPASTSHPGNQTTTA